MIRCQQCPDPAGELLVVGHERIIATVGIAAVTVELDGHTDLRVAAHWYVSQAGDY